MHLLAIESATRRVGVAIGSPEGLLGSIALGGPGVPAGSTRAESAPRHAEQLAPAIRYLLQETGVVPSQLAAIAVGIGPGAFTGLRVGVATAKVLAQALRVPVVPVPSLDLVAYPLRATQRLVVPAIDARRHEVYFAIYRPVPGGLQRESGYEIGTPADLAAELAARDEEALLAGDGALRFRREFADLEHVDTMGPSRAAPSLGALVELAAARFEREEFVPPSEVLPIYLRQSDAELARDRG
jgi:tRNA threonylcarbamoyladenosine biosynthesis protein TsaB